MDISNKMDSIGHIKPRQCRTIYNILILNREKDIKNSILIFFFC